MCVLIYTRTDRHIFEITKSTNRQTDSVKTVGGPALAPSSPHARASVKATRLGPLAGQQLRLEESTIT